ncbi:sugar ABC transporter ATP-binding protein [Anaerosacchariphilus polymeriproducens]|uniref:Sugar ABC transporter ATP-binding protein n=1 Tax=Anaerosacchariphilus polymeriproducens TaxID=1812858 RepID=A0A371ARQ6_9FIRM|nr:sugar ABC transporter ATP-binding protein [Anaerosacchariphilus polymeriproducens]RDU22238.1 sugar ABC transporter ATP-binding protein [Anaerosacchariphilus polymeriproducens]
MVDTILKMEGIHKQFSGVYALKDIHFELKKGEIHALLGENGAGKSTLIKILGGIYKADAGKIYISGKEHQMTGVTDSQEQGISVIHQELCLVPEMSVAENMYLGRESVYGHSCFVNTGELKIKAEKVLESLGLMISGNTKVSELSIAQQQVVEIAKALTVNAKILVMDEPTASLTEKEVKMLFKTIEELRKKQISIIYISHRLEEIFEITDRITIIRDGTYVGTKNTCKTTKDELISMMVGRKLDELFIKSKSEFGEVVFQVKNLVVKNKVKDVSFSVRKGEILGIAGLVGAGRTETVRAIFGIDAYESGEIYIDGKKVKIKNVKDAMRYGIGLVPENRKEQGLILIRSVEYNATLTILKEIMKGCFTNRKARDGIVNKYIQMLGIKTPSPLTIAKNLSGGNQQKIVIAKWLATNPKVLILDEPTRGVDVGAKVEIYRIMSMLAEQGVGIIMISSELPEIINMSDRAIVMNEGRVTGELPKSELAQEKLMYFATGGN